MKLTKHHFGQNSLNLVFLPLVGLFIVLSFVHKNESIYQLKLAFAAAIIFIIVSTIHHFFDKSLTFEIAFEYILIGAVAFLAVLTFVL